MPPQRSVPPARPVKTERTHEENQERAYIAASRRSDRSLEARVESARRASEIHKRRTGRSLRVTEQDVVNEEMYEEEDDDLPMRFRGIGAGHLHTSNADFNRRLQTYLTTQMAMRSTNQLFAEQFPNVPQFAQNQQSLYQQGIMAQQFQQQMMMRQQQQQLQQSPISPAGNYRQTPYPPPNMQQSSFQPNPLHGRSASIAAPQGSASNESSLSPAIKSESLQRRQSLNAIHPAGNTESTAPNSNPILTPKASLSTAQSSQQQSNQFSQFMSSAPFSTYNNSDSFLDFNLPTESQQLLGGDPMGSMFMMNQANAYMPAPYFTAGDYSTFDGKNNFSNNNINNTNNTINNNNLSANHGLNMTLAPVNTSDILGDATFDSSSGYTSDFFSGTKESGFGSTSGTPGGTDFDLFINGQDHWGQTPNSSQ